MMVRREAGTALLAVMSILAILLLMGLATAASALSVRLGTARGASAAQAREAAAAGLLLAGELPASQLQHLLEAKTSLPLEPTLWPEGLSVMLQVKDDHDQEGLNGKDGNGRIFLMSRASQLFTPGGGRLVVSFVQEALVGRWTPQPGALLDCAQDLKLCDGAEICHPPPSQISLESGSAMAVPEGQFPPLQARWRVHVREILRQADNACGREKNTCGPLARDLWLAAATDMIRRFGDPAGDARALPAEDVSRLVSGLLNWTPAASGAGTLPWSGGASHLIPDRAELGQVLEGLGRPAGHWPRLDLSPVASLLLATPQIGLDGGLCARLPALMDQALHHARALPDAARGPDVGFTSLGSPGQVYQLDHPLRVPPGQALRGTGLLILRARLEIAAGAAVRWRGEVVLEGGSVVGGGEMEIEGGLLLLVPSSGNGEAALDLSRTRLTLRGSPLPRALALGLAGTVLLSSWEETAFP